MQIIPAINCKNFKCIKEKLTAVGKIVGSKNPIWAQIDIADGKFTKHKTWNNPQEISNLKIAQNLNLEIHLMVENQLVEINKWIEVGAKRIIIHLEAILLSLRGAQRRSKLISLERLLRFARNDERIEIGLAINPNTPAEKLIPYLSDIKFIQLLAVAPGKSGQEFQPQILDKIKFLKKFGKKTIEVDGGINLQTAKLCKKAGADILVAGSYIWENKNPAKAYERLAKLT